MVSFEGRGMEGVPREVVGKRVGALILRENGLKEWKLSTSLSSSSSLSSPLSSSSSSLSSSATSSLFGSPSRYSFSSSMETGVKQARFTNLKFLDLSFNPLESFLYLSSLPSSCPSLEVLMLDYSLKVKMIISDKNENNNCFILQ